MRIIPERARTASAAATAAGERPADHRVDQSQGTPPNEPANFADVSETIDVTAAVHDDETPTGELEFQWTATAGTFDGTGPSVAWIAPAGAEAPLEVTLTLKVIEKYGQPGGPRIYQQDVSSSASVSLHDSTKEVGEMARQFLLDFSDSSILASVKSCATSSPAAMARKTRPTRWPRIDAGSASSSRGSTSRRRRSRSAGCVPSSGVRAMPARGCPCSGGRWTWWLNSTREDAGTDWLAAYYFPETARWRLCDSTFDGQKRRGRAPVHAVTRGVRLRPDHGRDVWRPALAGPTNGLAHRAAAAAVTS